MKFNPIGWLSRLLEKCGLKTYLSRVEFACHLFAGFTFSLIGVLLNSWWGHGIVIAYSALMIFDELYIDGHWTIFIGKDPKWKDFVWDICSKLAGPLGYLIWAV